MANAADLRRALEVWCFRYSRGAGTSQDRGNRLDQDLQVKLERPFIDVLQIQLHPLFKRDRASAANLPEAGDTRTNAEAAALPVFVEAFVVANRQWARPDEAHIAI